MFKEKKSLFLMWQQVGPLLGRSGTKYTPDMVMWTHEVKKLLEKNEKKQD